MKLDLIQYGPIISDKNLGNEIFHQINSALNDGKIVVVDFADVKSMATFNAKQIFGKLYKSLGPEIFFDKIEIKNATESIRAIIRMGIESAIDS